MSPLDKHSIEILSEVGQELLSGSLLTGWTVPAAVEIEDNWIRFQWSSDGQIKSVSPPSDGLAGQFAALSDASQGLIKEFAGEWGPLKICSHGIRHWGSTCRSKRLAYREHGFRESIQYWRRCSTAVKAMLQTGVALRNGLPMKRRDWWSFSRFVEVGRPSLPIDKETHPLSWELYTGAHEFDLGIQRRAFLAVLDQWVDYLNIRPQLKWYEGEETPQLVLSQGSLLESVLAHVLFAVSGTRVLETCLNCGRVYQPTRAPRKGEGHYCQHKECGRKAAVRKASTTYRNK